MILFFDGESAPMPDGGIWIRSISENTQNEELISVRVEEGMDWNRVCRFLEDAQAIVLTADVYMDSVSPRVLGFLEKIEQAVIGGESIGAKFYAILYTDLYEGEQTSIAMAVLKNFCERANITWGRGLGIGGNNLNAALKRRILRNFLPQKPRQGYVRFPTWFFAGTCLVYQGKSTRNGCLY